jgi:hypothetical protein
MGARASIAHSRDGDCGPHASARGIISVIAARPHVERIDMTVLAANEHAAPGDCWLPEHCDDTRNNAHFKSSRLSSASLMPGSR